MKKTKIKSIHIKNVRGLGDIRIELDMIPNKPSLLVAPNGTGKSSFAFAFQWLNSRRMKLNDDDAYMGNTENKPSIVVETVDPVEHLIADQSKNEISRKFGICVINSGIKASSSGIYNGVSMGKAHIAVPEIVLIDKIPHNQKLVDDFEEFYKLTNLPKGYYPSIRNMLEDVSFMSKLNGEELRCTKVQIKRTEGFIERSKRYEGKIDDRYNKIEHDDYDGLYRHPAISTAIECIRKVYPEDRNAKLLLKAIRLVTLYDRHKREVEERVKYAKYKFQEDYLKNIFKTLPGTWKEIKPHREGDKYVLKISDAQRISNGERDILVFSANLCKARSLMTKDNNILIIDEVFDYLDDANMIAAQFYITKLIDEARDTGKNIFPIILSHLNPDYFNQHYSFKDLKVYYLHPFSHPHASENMIKLLRQRKVVAQADKDSDDISKYMLHFNNDYSKDMSGQIGDCPNAWKDINTFKNYCAKQLDDYLNNEEEYDPLAVCVALREIIEGWIYSRFQRINDQENFLKKHGTKNKLNYAEEHNIAVPEIYYLLGNIYNDPMHIDDKNNKLITQTLYSRLDNATVRHMIKTVKNMCQKSSMEETHSIPEITEVQLLDLDPE